MPIGAVDLAQLPVANRQTPKWAEYFALNVPALPAGGSYRDPTTNTRVIRMTSPTFPVANGAGMHPYASGGLQQSQPWGPNGDTYTIYSMTDGSEGWLQDWQYGGSPFNLRATPWSSDLRFSFSMVAATPQKAYYLDSSARLWTYNTVNGATTLLKDFAPTIGGQQCLYLQLDNADRYFVFMNEAGDTVYWWDSATDTLKTVSQTTRIQAIRPTLGLDEPHFEKDGRYVEIKLDGYINIGGGDYRNSMIWDTTTDKLSDLANGWSHSEGLKSLFIGTNPNVGNEEYLIPSPITVEGQTPPFSVVVMATDSQFGAAESHRAGQWNQPPGTGQYELVSVDGPTGGRGGLVWTNVTGSIWSTPVTYQYEQALVGVRDVLELNAAGTKIANKLTKVANIAGITGPGMWCIVGSTVSVRRTDSGQPDTAGKTMYLEVTHLLHEALGFVKANFTDVRLAGHHYSNNPDIGANYYASPRATVSRDSRFLSFDSNMGTSGGRVDHFLMELPLSGSAPVQVLTSASITPASTSLTPAGTQQFVATGYDQTGAVMPFSPTWSVVAGGGTISPTGLFTAGSTTGSFPSTVKAAVGAVAAFASVTVQPAPPVLTSIGVVPVSDTLLVGGQRVFTAVGYDQNGNVIAITPTWSVVASGGSIHSDGTFTAGSTPGTYTNTVRATSGSVFGSATVTITAVAPPTPVLSSVVITPSSASVLVGGTQQYTATGYDQFDAVMAITPVWAVIAGGGTVSPTGLFTAGGVAGAYPGTIRATSGAVSGLAGVTVTALPPDPSPLPSPSVLSSVVVSPTSVTLDEGGTQAFSAIGYDQYGTVMGFIPVWSVVSGGGTITSGGVFTAGTTPGTFSGTVRCEGGAVRSSATVIVRTPPVVPPYPPPPPAPITRRGICGYYTRLRKL